jgi:hypothetical protein
LFYIIDYFFYFHFVRFKMFNKICKSAKKKDSQMDDLTYDSDSETEERNRTRVNFFLRISPYIKHDVPPLNKLTIWRHLSKLPNIREMIVAQEEIKIFPFQQDFSFVIFIITKKAVLEDEIMNYINPLLIGERVTTHDDPYRSLNSTPEVLIEGLINKNRSHTIKEATKVDMNCFFGGAATEKKAIIGTRDFHKK